jgi:fatty acid desaturase
MTDATTRSEQKAAAVAAAGDTGQTPSEQKAATTSLGDLVGEVTRDLSTLMRQELELAKAELRQSASRAAKGAGMLGGAAYAGMMAILFLSIALWWWLGTLIGGGWSGVVVAIIWAIVGGILYAVGRRKLQEVQGAPQTVETLKEIPDAFTRNEENR